MPDNKITAIYDDGNIPQVDLPKHSTDLGNCNNSSKAGTTGIPTGSNKTGDNAERLPESTRPRQDGPGGE